MLAIKAFIATAQFIWKHWGDEITAVTKFVFDAVGSVINTALDIILTGIEVALAAMRGDWGDAWNKIKGLVNRIAGGIANFVSKWATGLANYINSHFIQPVLRSFNNWATNTKNTVFNALNSIKNKFFTALGNVLEHIRSWARNALSAVRNALSQMTHAATGWIDNFTRPFREAKKKVLGEFHDLQDQLVGHSVVPDMLDMMVRVSDDSVDPMVQPYSKMTTQVYDHFATLDSNVGGKIPGVSPPSNNSRSQSANLERALSNLTFSVEVSGDETLQQVMNNEARVVVKQNNREINRSLNRQNRGTTTQ